MSRRKDRERAKHFVFRDGRMIPRAAWDKHQRELRELAEEQRLKALGLLTAKSKIVVAERAGLEKVRKQIMTPSDIMNERQPIRR